MKMSHEHNIIDHVLSYLYLQAFLQIILGSYDNSLTAWSHSVGIGEFIANDYERDNGDDNGDNGMVWDGLGERDWVFLF